MQAQLLPVIICSLVLICGNGARSNFLDSLPLVSQLKSVVQVIAGDKEGAIQTQENFMNTAVLVSQIKSGIQLIQGDEEGAMFTQKKFVQNAEIAVNHMPIVGHIKAGIHMATGDNEKGEMIMKAATSTTGAVVGGIVAGPAGVVLGTMAADAAIMNVDSVIHNEDRPYGIWEYAENIDKKDVGEHFDQVAGLGIDMMTAGFGGKHKKFKVRATDIIALPNASPED